ncbi:MAG: hypothetical protein ABW110_25145 [Steroidobacteraceae bacterium]
MIDPQYRVHAPPVDMALTPHDDTVGYWLMGICVVITLAALSVAFKEWKRSGTVILFLIVLGGAFANLAEPFVDLLGACWHPIIGQNTLFEYMGRPMPLWLLFPYIAYFGAQAMTAYYVFSRGASTRTMWLWFLVPVAADIILEECLLSFSDGLYTYYGSQPLLFHVFPIWWSAVNTIGIYLSAVLLTVLTPHLHGWRLAFVPFSTLLCYGATSGLIGLPSIIVINSEFPFWVTQLGGIATFALAALVVHACTRVIAVDAPEAVRIKLVARTA